MSPLFTGLLALAFLLASASTAQNAEDNRVVSDGVLEPSGSSNGGEEEGVEAALETNEILPLIKVNVSFYYESLCPASMWFVVNQLQPTWEQLRSYMNISLIPFGKSRSVENPDGSRTFYCQHGPRECSGNKMQSCALSLLPTQESQVQFVSCVMSKKDPSAAGPLCAPMVGLDFESVRQCFYSSQGEELQLAAERETNSIRKPLKYVPTIVYSGRYDQRKQDESYDDFKRVVCSQIPQPPEACLN